jgi:hypothetical protein
MAQGLDFWTKERKIFYCPYFGHQGFFKKGTQET